MSGSSRQVHFVTFGDLRYSAALNRIKQQAQDMQLFHNIRCMSINDLDPGYLMIHKDFIQGNPKGFGCCIWKPQVIAQMFDEMQDDDFLVYADAGCHLNVEARGRLVEYLAIAHQTKLCAFHLGELKEGQWTKGDVLYQFPEVDPDSPQLVGGIHVWVKCPQTIALLNDWWRYCQYYPNIDHSPSVRSNHSMFLEHRSDQSLFSCMVKRHRLTAGVLPDETYKIIEVPVEVPDETQENEQPAVKTVWDPKYPIQARRDHMMQLAQP